MRRRGASFLALFTALGCSSANDASTSGATGSSSTSATSTSSSSSSSSTSSSSGAGGSPSAILSAPSVFDLPYVVAGQGGSHASLVLENVGAAELVGANGGAITASLVGDGSLSAGPAPASLGAHQKASIELTFAGAPDEAIASAVLSLQTSAGEAKIAIYAVAGDPALGAGAWSDVRMPQAILAGQGLTIAMPTAPFPDPSGPWTDPSVHVFVPDGYRDLGAQDLVIHFHGFGTDLASTMQSHLYREQVYASGANAVLVVPQGPVNASSGNFGKLMGPKGLANLAREVLVVLYREGKIEAPVLGGVTLTSHSGGYHAVALNLDPANLAPDVRQVNLFDSLYGYQSTYEDFAKTAGKVFRSDYTQGGGTLANNQQAVADLKAAGLTVAEDDGHRSLAAPGPVIFFADSTHEGSTRVDAAYAEELRWTAHRSRQGPRVELREVTAKGGMATARWLAPSDDEPTGFAIETSSDGVVWKQVATALPTDDHASFPIAGGARVRVVPQIPGIKAPMTSDVYRVDDGAKVLVVDGFDRVLDGGFGGLTHDFAALVGEGAGPVATIAHRALTEDGFDLSPYAVVLWLLGDESTLDHALSKDEQSVVTAYLAGGGRLIMSGSELGYVLDETQSGQAFLTSTFGASFALDDSGSYSVAGEGALASYKPASYAGMTAPYYVDYPDAFALDGGVALLSYDTGTLAAVGVPHKTAIVGFPLELVDDPKRRAELTAALVKFVSN